MLNVFTISCVSVEEMFVEGYYSCHQGRKFLVESGGDGNFPQNIFGQHFGNCCPLAYSFGHVFVCMIVKRKYLQRYLRVAQENLTFETSELKM